MPKQANTSDSNIVREKESTIYDLCRFGKYSSARRLVCVDDKFSKPFKAYLGKDAVYDFINSIIEESKYCCDVMKKHLNKELVMTKEAKEDYKNSPKYWTCDNSYVDGDVDVK